MTDRQKDIAESSSEVHAERCPVCNGFGSLKYGELLCHACKGKGYVIVPNKIEREKEHEN